MDVDRSALGKALNALRQRTPGTCQRCGAAFPPSYARGPNARKFCTPACRQQVYLDAHPEKRYQKKPRPPEAPDG